MYSVNYKRKWKDVTSFISLLFSEINKISFKISAICVSENLIKKLRNNGMKY